MLDFAKARRLMVDTQLRTFDVNDLALLAAFDEVPRERFVPVGREDLAYIDQPIPVTEGVESERRFMLAPAVLARMIQSLTVAHGARVLDVACGLGYSSAILARLGASVVALESSERIADEARRRLAASRAEGVVTAVGPLERGYREAAPYDAILVNGAADVRPQGLLDQLGDGGRLVCVEGRGRSASVTLYVRAGQAFGARPLFDAAAPLLPGFQAEPGFVF
ncbi:MAG TPA: protein-L-isoaspartate O-methyltransferase [Beijerinckiaceae bacterium]|nr:protein-L-isoaspartate O-methyltransferase [Beijerinckiaceae bacterium]